MQGIEGLTCAKDGLLPHMPAGLAVGWASEFGEGAGFKFVGGLGSSIAESSFSPSWSADGGWIGGMGMGTVRKNVGRIKHNERATRGCAWLVSGVGLGVVSWVGSWRVYI